MFCGALFLTVFVTSPVSQDMLSTRLLGQDVACVRDALTDCNAGPQHMTLECRTKVSGQFADIHLFLSPVVTTNGSRAIIGYDVVFANFKTRQQALEILQPLLHSLEMMYSKHEQSEESPTYRFSFYDPKWASTEVVFIASGVENRIFLRTKAISFSPSTNGATEAN